MGKNKPNILFFFADDQRFDTINALGIDLNTYPYYERPDMGFDRTEDAKEPK